MLNNIISKELFFHDFQYAEVLFARLELLCFKVGQQNAPSLYNKNYYDGTDSVGLMLLNIYYIFSC
jgi:hypothetical protein